MDDYDKPFKSIEDQILLLKSRNLIINDVRYAKEILSNISYYTLINGYNKNLCDEKNNFINNVSIEELQLLYLLDIEINTIVMKYILFIERTFKTKLAYRIAEKFGVWSNISDTNLLDPNDYLYEKNYSMTTRIRKNTLLKLKDSLINSREYSTTSYYKKNKNHVPPWVLMNDISFTKSIFWYRILQFEDKSSIVNEIISYPGNKITQKELNDSFIECLRFINEYRNLIAHGNRTFSSMVSNKLEVNSINRLYDEPIILVSEYKKGIGRNDLYALLIAFSTLINDKFIFEALMLDIDNINNKFKNIVIGGKTVFEILNIPNDIVTKMKHLYYLKDKIKK